MKKRAAVLENWSSEVIGVVIESEFLSIRP